MIIDIHAHAFPEKIANRTIEKLSISGNAKNYTDGTYEDLIKSMRISGIDLSVILPVATTPSQTDTINKVAVKISEKYGAQGLISFGGIHPENDDYRSILKSIASNGIKGIKLHPVYQNVNFDDKKFMNIVDYACQLGLIVLTHAGLDFSFPNATWVTPKRIRNVIDTVKPDKLVLAHLGSWGLWNEVEEYIVGTDVYLDTAFSNLPVIASEFPNASTLTADPTSPRPFSTLDDEQFIRIVRNHGINRILFGTDTPWTSQKESVEKIQGLEFTQSELQKILYANAKKLLEI